VTTGKEIARLKGFADAKAYRRALAFSPDNKVLAVGGSSTPLRLFDVASGKEKTSSKEATYVNSLAFSPDGKLLAVGIGQGTVKLLDAATLVARSALKGNTGFLTFSSDSKFLAGASGRLTLWETATAKERAIPKMRWLNENQGAPPLAFSPDSKLLAVGDWSGDVVLWDLAAEKETERLKGHTSEVRALAFRADGKSIATAGNDGTIRLWDVVRGKGTTLAKVEHSPNVSCQLAFSPDHKTLACSALGHLMLWDAESGKPKANFPRVSARSLAFTQDGRLLTTVGSRGEVRVFGIPPES
jgi:WD40 repeat protein